MRGFSPEQIASNNIQVTFTCASENWSSNQRNSQGRKILEFLTIGCFYFVAFSKLASCVLCSCLSLARSIRSEDHRKEQRRHCKTQRRPPWREKLGETGVFCLRAYQRRISTKNWASPRNRACSQTPSSIINTPILITRPPHNTSLTHHSYFSSIPPWLWFAIPTLESSHGSPPSQLTWQMLIPTLTNWLRLTIGCEYWSRLGQMFK